MKLGSFCCGSAGKELSTVSMRMQVPSLALLCGFMTQHCRKLRCTLQMKLGSGVAIAMAVAGSCSSDSTPSLGIATCRRYGCKKKKKKKMILDPSHTPYIKINSKKMKDLNIRHETITILRQGFECQGTGIWKVNPGSSQREVGAMRWGWEGGRSLLGLLRFSHPLGSPGSQHGAAPGHTTPWERGRQAFPEPLLPSWFSPVPRG